MKTILAVALRSSREQLRKSVLLLLTIIIAPFFVLIYWLMSQVWAPNFEVGVINADRGSLMIDGTMQNAGQAATAALEAAAVFDSAAHLKVLKLSDRTVAERMLTDRKLAALVIFPPTFSQDLIALRTNPEAPPAPLTIVGDLTFQSYLIALAMATEPIDLFLQKVVGRTNLYTISEEPLKGSNTRTDFELAVPGLLILSVVMLIFQSAMVVAREVQSGTLRRLMMTPLTTFQYLAGIGITQLLIAAILVILTFACAVAFGFRTNGSITTAVLIGIITSISTIGVGLMISAFSDTETDAFVYANFPLFLMMFFSGAMFPFPRHPFFTIGAFTFAWTDLLPPSHAVTAINKVLNLGCGVGEITVELVALGALSALYFAAGVFLFTHRKLRRV